MKESRDVENGSPPSTRRRLKGSRDEEEAVAKDAEEGKLEKEKLAGRSWLHLIIAGIALLSSLVAGSSIGPVFRYLTSQGIRPCLAASWRCQCMSIFLAPVALAETYMDPRNKVEWFQKKPDLSYPVIVHVIFSGLSWSGLMLFWIVGMQYTSTFLAAILATSDPILLVIILRLQGTEVSRLEMIGVAVAFCGMIISCLHDLKEQDTTVEVGMVHQLIGYLLCLLASLSETMVIFNRIATKKYVSLWQYTFFTTLIVAVVATVTSVLLEGNGLIYTPGIKDGNHAVHIFCTEENCVFGWMSKKWFVKLFSFGLWIGVFCKAGLNYSVSEKRPFFSFCSHLFPC